MECAKEVEAHRNQINILMGAPLDDPRKMTLPDLFFDRPFPLPETLPLNLLARRPDLIARILKVEASASRVNSAKSAFFPNVNLKALAGLHTFHWKDLFSFIRLPVLMGVVALALCTFMQVLDSSIANVSLPHIAGDLSVSVDQGVWVITMFAVGNARCLPLTVFLMRCFGLTRTLIRSVLSFTIAAFGFAAFQKASKCS